MARGGAGQQNLPPLTWRRCCTREGTFDGEKVSVSENMTSRPFPSRPWKHCPFGWQIMIKNVGKIRAFLGQARYYMMNVIDYLVEIRTATGETGAFWWIQEQTGPLSLHPLMDFNQSFLAYDTLDGANCQTLFGRRGTQRQAAERSGAKDRAVADKGDRQGYFPGSAAV